MQTAAALRHKQAGSDKRNARGRQQLGAAVLPPGSSARLYINEIVRGTTYKIHKPNFARLGLQDALYSDFGLCRLTNALHHPATALQGSAGRIPLCTRLIQHPQLSPVSYDQSPATHPALPARPCRPVPSARDIAVGTCHCCWKVQCQSTLDLAAHAQQHRRQAK